MQKKYKKVLAAVILISLGMVGSAKLYYTHLKAGEDPRVLKCKEVLNQLGPTLSARNFSKAIVMLADVENIYQNTAGYKESFEMGVVEINNASIYLIQAEELILASSDPGQTLPQEQLKILLDLAMSHAQQSIAIYNSWQSRISLLSPEELLLEVEESFRQDPTIDSTKIPSYVKRRTAEIQLALKENHRRLSVSHTNLALIHRYLNEVDLASENYQKALDLWPENNSAANNLRVLQGKARIEDGLIEKLFPKDRLKDLPTP